MNKLHWLVLALLIAAFLLSRCAKAPSPPEVVVARQTIQRSPVGTPRPNRPTAARRRSAKWPASVATAKPITPLKRSEWPKMPLLPKKKGPLSGMVVVLDPGHGGTDPGAIWTEVFKSVRLGSTKVRYCEASYTYRMVGELTELLRQSGARVYWTIISKTMLDLRENHPSAPLPEPRDARFIINAQPCRAKWEGRSPRLRLADMVWESHRHRDQVVFISIHIDSMNSRWCGAHVCVAPERRDRPPQIGKLVAAAFRQSRVARQKDGKEVRLVDGKSLYIVRQNRIPESILVETGIPQNKKDSWRLRSASNRRQHLLRLVGALVKARKQRQTTS